MKYHSHTLKNGIRVVHQETNSAIAHAGIVINTGSREELEGEQGLAHFIEHVIFKGTTKRRAYHVLSRLEDVGGDLNAYTTKEETAIYASFLSEYYQRTLELFSDIFINSTFPEKELKREKEVIIEEINSYQDSPSELIYDDFEDQIFTGHTIGRNILGTPELVKGYTKEDVLRFQKRTYNTDAIVICSVGNIPFKRLVSLAERYFSDIPENIRQFERQSFSGYSPSHLIESKDTYQAHCIMGGTAYDIRSKKRMGLILLNNILGGTSMNSRLNLSLREKNGMAYNVETNYTAYFDTGILNIYFGTDEENLERAKELVYKEIDKLCTQKLGTLQLSKAKKQLIGQLAMSQENNEDNMLSLGKSVLFFNQLTDLKDINKKIEAIKAEELMDIANEILHKDRISTLIFK